MLSSIHTHTYKALQTFEIEQVWTSTLIVFALLSIFYFIVAMCAVLDHFFRQKTTFNLNIVKIFG